MDTLPGVPLPGESKQPDQKGTGSILFGCVHKVKPIALEKLV